jgi:hypothetical protein
LLISRASKGGITPLEALEMDSEELNEWLEAAVEMERLIAEAVKKGS